MGTSKGGDLFRFYYLRGFLSCDDISTHHYCSKVKGHLPSHVSTHPGVSYAVAYSVAKAGMNVQVAKYAAELGPRGIKVIQICHGAGDVHNLLLDALLNQGKEGVSRP
jgi:NAD(P)-dependent dehydrogenase (short-subunit alcohol dehydrogenase family)